MALESANYVNGLQSANPPSGDPVTQADDHLRLIKSTLLATFPNLNGPVLGTPAQMNSWVPTGSILLWSSSAGTMPAGYALCDGGTYAKVDGSGNLVAPDLRDRFVLGTGPLHAQGTTGGASSVATSTDQTTAAGSISLSAAGGQTGLSTGSTVLDITQIPSHSHTMQGINSGATSGSSPNVATAGSGGGPGYSVTTNNAGGGLGHSHTLPTIADHTHTATFTGSGHNHSITVATVPPYVSLVYMIKL